MRKITALALPLLFGAVTATAQDEPTENVQTQDDLTTGWYQIKMTAAHSGSQAGLNKWILNAVEEHTQSSGRYYSMEYGDYPTDNVERSYIYVDRNGTTTNYKVKSANGHYANYVGLAFRSTNYGDPVVSVSEGSVRLGTYWMPYNGIDHADIYCVAGSQNATSNRYALYKVDTSGYDIYTVHFDQNYSQFTLIDQPQLTCNSEAVKGLNKVYDNGNFFFESGTTVSASDFTAPTIEGYCAPDIIVDNEAKTVTVNYLSYAEKEAAKTEWLGFTGVGYPKADAASRQTFSAAIDAAETEAALNAAITAYKASTADIQMPEDGKAYTFTAVLQNGGKRLMYYDATDEIYYMKGVNAEATEAEKQAAKLICRDLGGGQYAFVNNAGKFFIWRGTQNTNGGSHNGYNDNKGFMDSFDKETTGITSLVVEKLLASAANVSANQEDLFGYMAVKGKRNANNNYAYFVLKTDDYDGAPSAYYNPTYSSAILIEEVEYPNSVSFNATDGTVDGADFIATFSAPFATVIPENVEAYYVSSITNEEETKAQMTKIETEAIPANQGVILVTNDDATAAAPVTMLPATTEEAAEIAAGANMLRHSAGEATDLDNGDYILTKRNNEGVAFYPVTPGTTLGMNKSYLSSNMMSAAAFSLSFGQATGIDTVTGNADNANAPIYDLSGRRVQKAVKGGLYIQNGRKFIVK